VQISDTPPTQDVWQGYQREDQTSQWTPATSQGFQPNDPMNQWSFPATEQLGPQEPWQQYHAPTNNDGWQTGTDAAATANWQSQLFPSSASTSNWQPDANQHVVPWPATTENNNPAPSSYSQQQQQQPELRTAAPPLYVRSILQIAKS